MYFLEYFTSRVHFAGHYIAVYGYDDKKVFVVDTDQQGGALTTSIKSFEKARLWQGPMASNALTWTIDLGKEISWPIVIKKAIINNSRVYLNPPIRNFGCNLSRNYRNNRHNRIICPYFCHPVDIIETIETIECIEDNS